MLITDEWHRHAHCKECGRSPQLSYTGYRIRAAILDRWFCQCGARDFPNLADHLVVLDQTVSFDEAVATNAEATK